MVSLSNVDLPEPLEYLLRLRIVRNVLYIHLLCSGATYSQRVFSSFGSTIDLSLDYTPVSLVRSSPTEVAVLAQEPRSVHIYKVGFNGTLIQTDSIALSVPSKTITYDAGQTKSLPEFCLLSTEGDRVSIVRRVNNVFEVKQRLIQTASQQLAYSDINNDKKSDILLYGKKRTGIDVLLRKNDGSYSSGPLLFPDVSIVDVKSADLNGDGITDLFVLDWLNNRLALFYGIGRGVFSEQVEVSLPGEPAELAISAVTKQRTLQIAVSIPDEKLVALFNCNATGEIEPKGTLKFPTAPKKVEFGDLNSDRMPDLVVTTGQAVYTFEGKSATQFGTPVPFGVGSGIVSSVLCDLDGDSKTDLAVIDRLGKRLVVCANSNRGGAIDWPSTYAVGSVPRGIAIADVNGDGLPDIAVANSGSSTLSVLLNMGSGIMSGQQAVSVAENPFSVKTVTGGSRRERAVVMSHASVDMVSIVKLAPNIGESSIFMLPTGSNPYVVFARQDSTEGGLELLVRYTSTKEGSVSLSLFKQISGGQFLESSLRPSLPDQITALTVDEYTQSGTYELAFVAYEKATKQSTLSFATSAKGFDFKTVRHVLSLQDSTAGVHSLTFGRVDDDPYKDIVLFMSAPKNAIAVLYGKGEGVFVDSLEIIRNVQPLNEESFLLCDVDNDGHMDVTWIDVGRNAILTMYGKGNRKFEPPTAICTANRVTALQVGGLRSRNSHDLVFANAMKGSITVMLDPFRK